MSQNIVAYSFVSEHSKHFFLCWENNLHAHPPPPGYASGMVVNLGVTASWVVGWGGYRELGRRSGGYRELVRRLGLDGGRGVTAREVYSDIPRLKCVG